MIVAIIILTVLAFCASIYTNWRKGKAALEDAAIQKAEAHTNALKESIDKTQKEVEDAAKNYNNVYDMYQRKYNKSPRDPNNK
jgi:heme/copper-type cytochrome/quinol oxidase subunit 1